MTQKPILSTNQIHRLHHTFFVPTGDIRASLLIVHGMSEHSGRYAEFAKFLAENGVLVLTYDQLGHGQTVKDKYELGFIDEKHPVQALCKDVIIMTQALKDKMASLIPTTSQMPPCFILGHSMGSFVVRTVLTHHATTFDGAILMGTSDSFGLLNRLGTGYLAIQNQLRPKKINQALANFVNHYLLNKLGNPISPSPFAWLAENTDAIRAVESDPLAGFAFTNNGFHSLQLLLKKAVNSAWYQHLSPTFPILFVSGKDDPVGNLGQDVYRLCNHLINQQKNATAILYPNMRHEILHETNHHKVYQDILTWLIHHS